MPFQLSIQWDGDSRTFDLSPGENLVGSESGCDIVLRHPGVSRHHAVLLVLGSAPGDTLEVADLGSQNGTFVDGRRLTRKASLHDDSALAFGAIEACVERVRDDDVQAATLPSLETAASPAPAQPRCDESLDELPAATTASVGPLQLFALIHLPRLADALGRMGPGASEPAARAAGQGLAASLPCEQVTISRGRGVLFQTAEPKADGYPVEVRADDFELRVEFRSASSSRLYAPIVESVARLVAMSVRRGAGANRAAPEPVDPPPPPEPATLDPELRSVYERAARVAASAQNVLIYGDSGTGKELLARYVHTASPRRDRPFVALNCAALPDDLLEAELFGIETGVATGVDARPGRFEQADGGTLFLDEIGDMAPSVQSKILRVLQEKEVHRLGGLEARAADVRVVSATHRDLDSLRAEGRFREDLYHRIADWRFRLPTLAQRAVDIPNLAVYFLAREAGRRGLEARGISRAALRVLCRHPWPGNVRQLEKEIAKAALFVEDRGLLDTRCLDDELLQASSPRTTLREHLELVETQEICRALAACDHDVPRAAEDLGLPESTLYRKIRALGIDAAPGKG